MCKLITWKGAIDLLSFPPRRSQVHSVAQTTRAPFYANVSVLSNWTIGLNYISEFVAINLSLVVSFDWTP